MYVYIYIYIYMEGLIASFPHTLLRTRGFLKVRSTREAFSTAVPPKKEAPGHPGI